MSLSGAEQYMLELINRGRLDPAGDAARYGTALNAGLGPGQITAQAKQVLAPNALLETAAIAHSQWMLQVDIFSHTGSGGSTLTDRVNATGYHWTALGENLGMSGTTGAINMLAAMNEIYSGLFLSAGHRVNLLNGIFTEVGLGAETGVFTQSGTNYNTVMMTQDFGTGSGKAFLTGVAYSDTDKDAFYSIGEGRSGVTFTAQGITQSSAAAGGYAIGLTAAAAVSVTGKVNATAFSATVDMSHGNVKLDVVDGTTFLASGNITLISGIQNVRLLGVGSLSATGNGLENRLTGNSGVNTLDGKAGNDVISGANGNDRIFGGDGNDTLSGQNNNDEIHGGIGVDQISGGAGADKIYGDAGNDKLAGGTEADRFVFTKGGGADVVSDFSLAQHDTLLLDDALWGSVVKTESQVVSQFAHIVGGVVVFDFGAGQTFQLSGVTTLTGLAAAIDFY